MSENKRCLESGNPPLGVEPVVMPWKSAFERMRKDQYDDHGTVTMFNFSRRKMDDAMEVAAAVDEAVEWGCRWEALAAAQSETINALSAEIARLKA